uniref:Uncharacterized protein n=1 Tax=Panagrolaimus sp. ES5 TaxID=591445 RepID=A0AC34F0B2_9BILA
MDSKKEDDLQKLFDAQVHQEETQRVIEILQQKLVENTKAHDEMQTAANTSNDLTGVIQMCENYFQGLKESKDDILFKHHWIGKHWFVNDKFYGYEILQELLDHLRDQLYFEIISDCQFIEQKLKEMIKALKEGKDFKSFLTAVERKKWNDRRSKN